MGFGDYCCTLPVSLITQKRGRAEGATPALAQTKGKRFACFQEPEGDESINVGLMKELSGGDTLGTWSSQRPYRIQTTVQDGTHM